ncbi:MAG: hypothetical protein WAU81_14515, partial [Candidatus Aminicenantales bacterium]
MNLWSMDLGGTALRQHTFHKGYDVSSPSLHNGKIAYQLVADLHLYDVGSGDDRPIPITLPSDFDQMREKWVSKPSDYLTSVHLSPSGDRLVLISRGNVFVAPVEDGRWVRVSRQDGVRSRAARFLGDGKSLMILSDQTGEWEFHGTPADGLGPEEQLTAGAKVIRFDGIPSPDGRSIAFADKDNQLWVYSLDKKTLSRVAESSNGMFDDLAWSADSQWLAFVQTADNSFQQVMLLNTATGQISELTDNRVDSYSPAWSPDGKWLYFLSDRYFRSAVGSPWGPRQPEPYFDKTTKIYALALTAKEIFPFAPANELNMDKKEQNATAAAKAPAGAPAKEEKSATSKGSKDSAAKVVIELAGLQDRVFEVPLPAGVYSQLSVSEKMLFFIDRERAAAIRNKLQAVEVKNRNIQAKTVLEDVRNFELSSDGKKILVQKDSDLYVIDAAASAPPALAEKKIDMSRWTFSIDPKQEWRQMFNDAWRMERDYFYDRNLHNVDYQGLLERHRPFVD